MSEWKRHSRYLGDYRRLGEEHPVIKVRINKIIAMQWLSTLNASKTGGFEVVFLYLNFDEMDR